MFRARESKMQPQEIFEYCLQNLEGTVFTKNWGEYGVFYNPDNTLKKGIYIKRFSK